MCPSPKGNKLFHNLFQSDKPSSRPRHGGIPSHFFVGRADSPPWVSARGNNATQPNATQHSTSSNKAHTIIIILSIDEKAKDMDKGNDGNNNENNVGSCYCRPQQPRCSLDQQQSEHWRTQSTMANATTMDRITRSARIRSSRGRNNCDNDNDTRIKRNKCRQGKGPCFVGVGMLSAVCSSVLVVVLTLFPLPITSMGSRMNSRQQHQQLQNLNPTLSTGITMNLGMWGGVGEHGRQSATLRRSLHDGYSSARSSSFISSIQLLKSPEQQIEEANGMIYHQHHQRQSQRHVSGWTSSSSSPSSWSLVSVSTLPLGLSSTTRRQGHTQHGRSVSFSKRSSWLVMGKGDGKKKRKKKDTTSMTPSPKPSSSSSSSSPAPLRVTNDINIPIRRQIQWARMNKEAAKTGTAFRQKRVERTRYRRAWSEYTG